MEAPVCLITSDSDGKLCVVMEAKEILDRITQPVVVVSIVGLYRMGKSYLMNRLGGQQTGSSGNIEKFNLPRCCLRHFFAERRCFVFPRPAGDDELARMEELAESDLDKRFLQRAEEFCKYVFSSAKPKTLTWGRILTASALCNLAELYVEAIRNGQIPSLENAIVSLAKIQNERAVDQGFHVYQSKVLEFVGFPVDPSEMPAIHREAETAAIQVFISNSFNDTEQKAQLKLMEKIQTVYQDLCVQNREESLNVCEKELTQIFSPMEEAVNDGSFVRPGGYREYCDNLQSFKNEYRARTHKQLMSEEVLSKYLKTKDQFGKNILSADQCLSEAEQEKEVERLHKEILQQKNKSLEEIKQLQEQMFQDQKRTYEQHMTQLLENMKKEMERAKEDNERVLEAKRKEQNALIEEGFKDMAAEMNKEVENLKGEMKINDESKRSTLSKLVDSVGMAASLFLPGIIPKATGFAASYVS